MPHAITIPRLGWSMEQGILSEWLKAPGAFVAAGDMLFMLEGEKAAQEIESLDSGYLCIPHDSPQSGATVKVGQVIGFLLLEGEAAPVSVHSGGPLQTTTMDKDQASTIEHVQSRQDVVDRPPNQRVAGPAARRLVRKLGVELSHVSTPDPTGRVLSEDVQRTASRIPARSSRSSHQQKIVASPRARRRARELGIDWTLVRGTGRGGRIRERDVLSADLASTGAHAPAEMRPSVPGRSMPSSKLRRVIAQRMQAGVHTAAPVTLTMKANASTLVSYREQLKQAATQEPLPSFNDLLIYLSARAIAELPELNVCWYGDHVYAFSEIHIATAIDTSDGLVAPVLRHTERLSLIEIAQLMRELIEQARAGKLTQEQLSGGTFTLTNLGMFGIDAFTPILNLPQAAILGIGRIIHEPVLRNGAIEPGHTLTLSLTFDHRAVDGAPAARWLKRLCEKLESVPLFIE